MPDMYKALTDNPDYLEMTCKKVQMVMGVDGKLGRKTKDIIALTVCIMSGSDYCIDVYDEAVRNAGLNDEALVELYSIIDTYTGLNSNSYDFPNILHTFPVLSQNFLYKILHKSKSFFPSCTLLKLLKAFSLSISIPHTGSVTFSPILFHPLFPLGRLL